MPPQTPKTSLLAFWKELPREGRLLLSVVAFQFIGTGLVLPFWVIYLHEVRGFSVDVVGLLLGWLSMGGLIGTVPGGAAIDTFGPRRVFAAAVATTAVGQAIMAFATTIPLAVLGLGLVGVSFGVTWPASQSFVTAVVPEHLRQRYFGLNFALLNLGIGIGGVLGGFMADVSRPVTFQIMYLWESASYLPALFLLLVPLRHVGNRVEHAHHVDPGKISYLAVAKRPGVPALIVVNFLVAFVGYGQINSGAAAYARLMGGVSTQGLGIAFAVNTGAIVLLQLVVLQRIEGIRRTRLVAVMSVIWAVSWLLLASSALVPATLGATMLVAAFMGVFALGETLMQPSLPAMVNGMAPDHLRGRYNGICSAAFNLASVLAPISAGWLIDRDMSWLYIVSLLVGCALLVVFALGRLEQQLTPQANGLKVAA
ncbi:MAG: MFS transporter [Marmoricola sp.]